MNQRIYTPTRTEKQNGWTTETLTRYMREREQSWSGIIMDDTYIVMGREYYYRSAPMPEYQNSKYNPFKCWR